MPAEPGRVAQHGLARETRLLIMTLVISAVVLVLLARFRFPDRAGRPAAPPATALDELATRGAFEAQAIAMRNLARRLVGALVLLRARHSNQAREPGAEAVLLTGLRIRDELALVGLPGALGPVPEAVEVFADTHWRPAAITGADHPRRLLVVRIPTRQAPVLAVGPEAPRAPGYFAAASSTPAGPSLSPVWLGTLAPAGQTIWNGPVWLLPPNGSPSAGTPIYAIDGTLVGVVAEGLHGRLLVPATLALRLAGELAGGRSLTGADAGCDIVELSTPALRAAAGRPDGVLVGWVDPAGPAHDLLQTGDVVVGVDSDQVRDSTSFHAALARREAGVRATFAVVRAGQVQAISIVLRAPSRILPGNGRPPATAADSGSPGLGITLRQVRDGVTIVGVDPRGTAAGLVAPGDRVTWLRGHPELTPSAMTRAYESLPSGGALLFRITPHTTANDRQATPASPERVVAVLKP